MPGPNGNALASEAIAAFRSLYGDLAPSTHFTDATALGYLERASKWLNREILFPLARWVIPTIAAQGEYVVTPGVLRTDSVRLNGQLVSFRSQATMEGRQIGYPDMSGVAATQNTSAPPGGGVYAPAWVSAVPSLYPTNFGIGGMDPYTQAFTTGQSPTYFWRGGAIDITPAPSMNGGQLVIEGVASVPIISATTQETMFLPTCVECLAWKMAELAKFSDDSDRAAEARNYAASQANSEMRKLRTWNRRRTGDNLQTPKVRDRRSLWLSGNNRGF